MSEVRPDAEPVKAARKTVAFEPTPKTEPDANGTSRTVVWVVGVCVVVALLVSGLYFTAAPGPAASPGAATAAAK
jgi:hypothetical protein